MDERLRREDAPETDKADLGHETRDINVRIIVGFGVSLVVAAVLIHLFVWLLFDVFGSLNGRSPAAGAVNLPPAPRLQAQPREDLKALRAEEEVLLHSYTWIDRTTGAVRIPIDQAMKKVLDQGLPTRAPVPVEPGRPEGSASGRFVDPVQR